MWIVDVEYMDGQKRTFARDVVLQNGYELKLANMNPVFNPKEQSAWHMYTDNIYIPCVVIRQYRAKLEP